MREDIRDYVEPFAALSLVVGAFVVATSDSGWGIVIGVIGLTAAAASTALDGRLARTFGWALSAGGYGTMLASERGSVQDIGVYVGAAVLLVGGAVLFATARGEPSSLRSIADGS